MRVVRTAKKLRRRGRNTARGWLAQALKTYLRTLESTETEKPREELAAQIREFVDQILNSSATQPRSSEPVNSILNSTTEWLVRELGLESEVTEKALQRRKSVPSAESSRTLESAFKGLTPLTALHAIPPRKTCPPLVRDSDGSLSSGTVKSLRDFHPEIVLISPQIPPNTGTIARLCAALSCRLHLIEPIGFDVSEKSFRRAGLDYWPHVELYVHPTWDEFIALRPDRRIICVETGGRMSPSDFQFEAGDLLVFGAETFGIPQNILAACGENQRGHLITIPMFDRGVRSLNLANSVSIAAHCALHGIHSQALALQS
jgi:tRNA (cytidine/uridine-2'-O-)-methyltransferase